MNEPIPDLTIEGAARAMWEAAEPNAMAWHELDELKDAPIKQDFRRMAAAAIKEVRTASDQLRGLMAAAYNSLHASEQPFYVGMSLLKAEFVAGTLYGYPSAHFINEGVTLVIDGCGQRASIEVDDSNRGLCERIAQVFPAVTP